MYLNLLISFTWLNTIDIDFVFDFLFINIEMHSTCYFSFSYKYKRMNKLNITENFYIKMYNLHVFQLYS